MKRASVLLLAGLLVTTFIAGAEGRDQQAPASTIPLDTIEVSGLKRYTQDQVIAISGLRIGQP